MKTGDQVRIECDGVTADARVALASENGVSLLLVFDALIAGSPGAMPVLRGEDGIYRSIMTNSPVTITPTD